MGVIRTINSDLKRVDFQKRGGVITFVRWYFFPQGSTFPHDVWFRLLQDCKKCAWKKYTYGLLVYLIERHFAFKYGIHANSNMPVGEGLKIVHGEGIFLNCKSVGKNVTVYPGVMLGGIGETSLRMDRLGVIDDVPTVEDDVIINTGAVVTGSIVLGKGCVVAANAYVNRDVPEYTLVAGLPARIVKKFT